MSYILRLALFFFLLSPVCFAQAPISPQLRALLDFYFRGPGSSNSVDRIQIKNGAINLDKMDLPNVVTFLATKTYVDSASSGNSQGTANALAVHSNELAAVNLSLSGQISSLNGSFNSYVSSFGSEFNSFSNYVNSTFVSNTVFNAYSNYVDTTFLSNATFNAYSNYVDTTFLSNATFNAYSNYVDTTFVSNTAFNAYSNYVDTTFVSNTAFNAYSNYVASSFVSNSLLGVDVSFTIVASGTNFDFTFEKGILKGITITP